MKMKYYGKFMDVTDSLRAYADKKLAKLDWFFSDNASAQVKFTQERGGRNIVEITINDRNMIFRAEDSTTDMYASVDKAVDKLSGQIRRHRTKLDKRLHINNEPVMAEPEAEAEAVEEADKKVVRVKRFAVKPMSVEDAIMQMEMLGHNFYLFENAETNRTCVLYVRQDGDYGLLEPEN